MPFSTAAIASINRTSGDYPLYLLQIDHADLATPIRLVNDGADCVSGGNTYVALPFQVTLPDDFQGQLPRAQLSVDNIGRELTVWLEASRGGQGATATIRQVMRATPDVVEAEITMDLTKLSINNLQVTGELGFTDTLNSPAVLLSYRPDNAPGLFPARA